MSGSNFDPKRDKERQQQYDKKPNQGQQPGQGTQKSRDPLQQQKKDEKDRYK